MSWDIEGDVTPTSLQYQNVHRDDTLLQNATAILLQNATEVYYKMLQLFFTTQNHSFKFIWIYYHIIVFRSING